MRTDFFDLEIIRNNISNVPYIYFQKGVWGVKFEDGTVSWCHHPDNIIVPHVEHLDNLVSIKITPAFHTPEDEERTCKCGGTWFVRVWTEECGTLWKCKDCGRIYDG